MPKNSNLLDKILWFIVSKALARSIKVACVIFYYLFLQKYQFSNCIHY